MVGVTLTQAGRLLQHAAMGDPGIPVFQVNMLWGDDQLYVRSPFSRCGRISERGTIMRSSPPCTTSSFMERAATTRSTSGALVVDARRRRRCRSGQFHDRRHRTDHRDGRCGQRSLYGNAHNFYGTINGGSGDDFFSDWHSRGLEDHACRRDRQRHLSRRSRGPADDHRKARRGDRYGPTDLPGGLRPAGQCRHPVVVGGNPPPPSSTITGNEFDNTLTGGSIAETITAWAAMTCCVAMAVTTPLMAVPATTNSSEAAAPTY